MKRIAPQKTVKLTEQQEQRLAKLYSILDMINPVEMSQSQTQTNYDNEKTVILAEPNLNIYSVPA